jgi:hypothetical protein
MITRIGSNISVVLLLMLMCISTQAQSPNNSPQNTVNQKGDLLPSPTEPLDCELASRFIDDVINRVAEDEDSTLIVLINLAKNEPNNVAKKRVQDITIYLKNRGLSNFEIGIGENTDRIGKFNFYVKGYRLYSLPVKKGKTFNLMRCWIV